MHQEMVVFEFKNTVRGPEASPLLKHAGCWHAAGLQEGKCCRSAWGQSEGCTAHGLCHTRHPQLSVTHTACSLGCQPPQNTSLQSLLQMCGELSTRSDHRAARCPADLGERLLGLTSTSAQGRRWHRLAQSHYLAEGCSLHQKKRCTNKSVHQRSRGKLCHSRLDERQSPHSEDKRAQHTAHRDLCRIAAEHEGEAAL